MNGLKAESLRQVIASEQIQKRVKELGRHISDDYRGQTIQALAVLENAFMFMADLVRALDVPVVCQFIKPKYSKQAGNHAAEIMEIFFSHEPDIRGQHVRSEEHTSELQSLRHLVCRLLLEKKKNNKNPTWVPHLQPQMQNGTALYRDI